MQRFGDFHIMIVKDIFEWHIRINGGHPHIKILFTVIRDERDRGITINSFIGYSVRVSSNIGEKSYGYVGKGRKCRIINRKYVFHVKREREREYMQYVRQNCICVSTIYNDIVTDII